MREYSKQQREAMAADLAERGARKARHGFGAAALDLIEQARALLAKTPIDPETDYCEGLASDGISSDAIDEAVQEIRSGRVPEDSLPGRLFAYRGQAMHDARTGDDFGRTLSKGQAEGVEFALTLLGCKVTP